MDLKKQHNCAILYMIKHLVCPPPGEEGEMSYHCNFLRQHFMQASDQKTSDMEEKSRAALMPLDICGAHPVRMFFSGFCEPLVEMFQRYDELPDVITQDIPLPEIVQFHRLEKLTGKGASV